ncbi:hypothetical protein HUT18_24030 [Streptomyces sp. NA04227]|uniref:hypothetical protein n=1 Tax=Streptomyces sp. NA04227 TaxID=2742136 RepID=UPI00158FC024|nr:hypothetical protein [Streptomyces sp. NA04227]QKW08995.1 hypothetical protein HUT18_24030 [Streptomyces sp. NA04227]
MNAHEPYPSARPRVPRQPRGPEAWQGPAPDGWEGVRPVKAWYALVALLMLCGAGFTGLGVVAGLFLTAGKHLACDTTTACDRRPYEEGYQDPGWSAWPFVTAAVLAALAVLLFTAVFLARRRNHAERGPGAR